MFNASIIGGVVNDPQLTKNGNHFTFRVAVQVKRDVTEFVTIIAEKRLERIIKGIKKGTRLYVSGKLSVNKEQNKNIVQESKYPTYTYNGITIFAADINFLPITKALQPSIAYTQGANLYGLPNMVSNGSTAPINETEDYFNMPF